MENKILTDPLVKPEDCVLEAALGKNYKLYTEFTGMIIDKNINPEWHYYNDGKSWLCKLPFKKKNLGWLSIWDTGFKLTFFFPDKAMEGIYQLDIDDEIKNNARNMKPVGKSHPIVILVKNKKLIKNGLKILEYKMNFK